MENKNESGLRRKIHFANVPFNLLDNKHDRFLLIAVVLVFSIFFLNVFEPFNIGRWYSDSGIIKFLRLSSYGFVVALVFLFTQFPLRRMFNKQQFDLKSYLLWLIIEIALISLVYIFLYGNPVGNFKNDFIFSLKYTLLGICLPYSFAVLVIYYKNQRAEIETLKSKMKPTHPKQLLSFYDENDKIKFSMLAKDLLLLESTDNYVSVFYLLENKVQRTLLRNTLKNLETELVENGIIRCHRSYMVNMQNVEFMQKNGKKLIAKIKHMEREIPVSQKYAALFLGALS